MAPAVSEVPQVLAGRISLRPARISPALTAIVVIALCALAVFAGPRQIAAPPEPIAGVLYLVSKDTPAVLGAAISPTGESPVVEPPKPVAPKASRVLAKPAPVLGKVERSAKLAQASLGREPATVVVALSSAGAVAPMEASSLVRTTAPAAAQPLATPPAPKPEAAGAAAFGELDESLRQSPTTQTINLRVKKGGVIFRITHVGRASGRAAVRFAVANEESADFFLSIVNVAADGNPLPAEAAGPYACRSGEEIFGIVHFTPQSAAGKRLAVTLVQSGGERRRFQLGLDYRF